MLNLKGKTLLIGGSSRRKLLGTVYSAVKEIEFAGGRGLVGIADVRGEHQMEVAVA